MSFGPVIGRLSIQLELAPPLAGRLPELAAGRPLVIDYHASLLRGIRVGDINVMVGEPDVEPCFIELNPIEGVVVLAHRRLIDLLNGATLREAGPPWNRHLALTLATPEAWIDFLETHPCR